MKFVWDENMIRLTEEGLTIIELFKEYVGASQIVKDAILVSLSRYRNHTKVQEIMTTSKTEEEFTSRLKALKSFAASNQAELRWQAAKEFANKYIPEGFEFVFAEDKEYKNLVIRKKIGIKSSMVREIFNVETGMTDADYFRCRDSYIFWFMKDFVKKKISTFIGAEMPLHKDIIVIVQNPVKDDRFINIFVDFNIDIKKLTRNTVINTIDAIKLLEKQKFF